MGIQENIILHAQAPPEIPPTGRSGKH